MERMTSLELVASAMQGRALPTELHPQKVQGMPSASTEAALRQVVKERSTAKGGAIHRSPACGDALAVGSRK